MTASRRIRLLAVDDLPDNLDLIREVFENEQYEVLTAETAEKGLQLAAHSAPDVAILDVQMPGMDGYELCRRLRESPATRRIPIVFLTAQRTDPADAAQGLDLGACDYVSKPFSADELRARIRALMRVRDEHESDVQATRRLTRRLYRR